MRRYKWPSGISLCPLPVNGPHGVISHKPEISRRLRFVQRMCPYKSLWGISHLCVLLRLLFSSNFRQNTTLYFFFVFLSPSKQMLDQDINHTKNFGLSPRNPICSTFSPYVLHAQPTSRSLASAFQLYFARAQVVKLHLTQSSSTLHHLNKTSIFF